MIKQATVKEAQHIEGALWALLLRCRHALAVGGPEWERDIDTAMALDAALVKEIDAALGSA